MATSVHEVFEAFRRAPSNYERGLKFEQLMAQYLPLDSVYGRLFNLDPLISWGVGGLTINRLCGVRISGDG